MKQVVQNYRTGELLVETVPAPICKPGGVLVRVAYSLVSAGTERMKVEQARMNLVQMARSRPDKVRQTLQSVRQVGLRETVHKVQERLDALTPLGYSLAGTVQEVGDDVDEFSVGDRVACAGEGIACHAEFVSVPRNLCVAVPTEVELRDAAFTTVGAIAINGVRQAGVTIGENVLVIGLGLVGLLAVQILKAAGCRVVGVDVDLSKLELAKRCGADYALGRDEAAIEETIRQACDGVGPDVAYLAASTKSADPMELAGRTLRDRGRVVVVGMMPVQADWQTYYAKELSVFMSRSYGPGRYDRSYEQRGIDYPIGYVPWTQRRNFVAFLSLIEAGKVQPSKLEPETFDLEAAPDAYRKLRDMPGKHAAGLLFRYPDDAPLERRMVIAKPTEMHRSIDGPVAVGLIGAGNFATGTIIPALKRIEHVHLHSICSAGGLSAKSAARRHGFAQCSSDYRSMLNDKTVDAVVIATHHDTHARFAVEAMRAGKHVFVEKPLALTDEQLRDVAEAQRETGRLVMPGFNRRYSPLSVAVREFFAGRAGPIEVLCRVNAGTLKADSWYQDAEEGGWRIISEGCHFVDLIQFLCGCPVTRVFADRIGGDPRGRQNDNCTVTLKMMDGSLATLVYVAHGDPSFEKERIEVFGQGCTAVIRNFRTAELWSNGRRRKLRAGKAGKGHQAELHTFIDAVRGNTTAFPSFEDACNATSATLAIVRSLSIAQPVNVPSCVLSTEPPPH